MLTAKNELQGSALREFSLRSVNGTLSVREMQTKDLRYGNITTTTA